MRQEREAAWKAGMEEGRRSGIEEGRRSGLEEGKRFGLAAGEEQLLTLQIRKKLEKGKDVAVIAAELEETEERIRELICKMKK